MTIDAIRQTLCTADDVPADALRAAVPLAAALAPDIYAIADKFRRGIWLMPEDDKLLFYGLHVLAAAKHADLLPCLMLLIRRHDGDLDALFADHASLSLLQLFRSVWDGDPAQLLHMLEHADLTEAGRVMLFNLVARLTFEGRMPRATTEHFLERFERDGLAADDDLIWWDWEDTVTRLGFVSLEPALRRVWAKPVNKHQQAVDRQASLDEVQAAAADPNDPKPFGSHDMTAVTDPVEALAWITKRQASDALWIAEYEAKHGPTPPDDDPAKDIRLTDEEFGWLAGFLGSSQVPDTTMSIEHLDGLFTALIIGPASVPPSEYLKEIWGTDDGQGPVWDTTAQGEYFLSLLQKHWDAIAARGNGGGPIPPWIDPLRNDMVRGMEWADGFELGVELRSKAWDTLFEHPRLGDIAHAILDLNIRPGDDGGSPMGHKQRVQVLNLLPIHLQRIAAYWKDPLAALAVERPVRSSKVGRNDPCPCGSGKKYKKCCGGTTGTVH